MNYVTTNIRLPEEEYLKLKAEAAEKRKSLAAIIRGRIGARDKAPSKAEVDKIMAETRKLAKRNAKVLKGWDSLKALREIRSENPW